MDKDDMTSLIIFGGALILAAAGFIGSLYMIKRASIQSFAEHHNLTYEEAAKQVKMAGGDTFVAHVRATRDAVMS